MTEQTTPAASTRPTGTVKYIELAQVVSAAAIGVMILPLFSGLAYYGWWWTILIVVAVAGALVPFFLARVEYIEQAAADEKEDHAWYVVNEQRIATLQAIALPADVIHAVQDRVAFG